MPLDIDHTLSIINSKIDYLTSIDDKTDDYIQVMFTAKEESNPLSIQHTNTLIRYDNLKKKKIIMK